MTGNSPTKDAAKKRFAEPSEMYCKRLTEKAFARYGNASPEEDPGAVEIDVLSYEAVLKRALRFANRTEGMKELEASLAADPKLQLWLSTMTDFTPSKWLLEQEMMARGAWPAEDGADIYAVAAGKGLVGVSFSGGGIRSATFNLGVAQALAQVGMLPRIDYLSSVSGGGYIHQFLAGWLLRDSSGRSGVIRKLIPQAEPGCLPRSPEPIRWLVRYASYLTPARGLFTADTWTMISIWLRNTILNQIPILFGFAAAFFLVHLLIPAPIYGRDDFWIKYDASAGGMKWCGLAALAGVLISLGILARNLYLQLRIADEKDAAAHEVANRRRVKQLLTNRGVQLGLILPWMLAAVWVTFWAQVKSSDFWLHWVPLSIMCGLVLATVMVVIVLGGSFQAFSALHPDRSGWQSAAMAIAMVLAGCVTAAFACLLGWGFVAGAVWVSHWLSGLIGPLVDLKAGGSKGIPDVLNFSFRSLREAGKEHLSAALRSAISTGIPVDPWRIRLTILPPMLLTVPYVAIELTLGLLGRDFSETRREWLARLRAWSLLAGLLWVSVASLALLGPYLVYFILGKGWGWISSTVAGFFAAHLTSVFASWSGKGDGNPTDKGIFGLKPMDLVALIAGPITITGMLIALSYGVSLTADGLLRHFYGIADTPAHFSRVDWLGFFVALAIAALFAWRVDINEFSMLSFYRNRLARCYLGATLNNRQPDPFTGFDDRTKESSKKVSDQTIPPRMIDLLPEGYASLGQRADGKYDYGQYKGPFPVFCTTINLTTGKDLATQERKGASFAFTPLYSGYSVSWTQGSGDKVSFNGFVPTEEYAYREKGIHLDTVTAISGAAANPNMGYNSNPALAFLMTFFNVRLGWWISNPRRRTQWRAESRSTPNFPGICLLHELFGSVDDASRYVNLSDGGHFDNMGLYELVRRRCKYILVCDAEADAEMKFEGMGTAIAKCRMDFGAEIDLDLRPLQIDAATGFSSAHCVVGTIQYPPPVEEMGEYGIDGPTSCESAKQAAAEDRYAGIIVYMKSSLVGDEPPDLLAYKLRHDVFPNDMTANQWFTETQFESYRRLGHHVAMTAIQPALSPQRNRLCDPGDADYGPQEMDALFQRMYAIWYPRTPEMEKYLGDHLKQYEGILKELRERKELVGLEARLNDPTPWKVTEIVTWKVPEGDALGVLYPGQFANSLIDFMYTIYTDLQLAFPDNRVSPHAAWWICLFRRWCRVTLLRDAWSAHEVGYPLEFQLFAQRELNLP